MKTKKVKVLDIVISAAVLAIAVSSFLIIRTKAHSSLVLEIDSPEGNFIYPLDKDGVYEVKGQEGYSVIQVKDGKAAFMESPCPGKDCISMGSISETGQWASCLPNRIFISVKGNDSQLDAVAR